ncbi:MAG: hypothetical protein ACK48E_04870, partial [Holosporales bacterium]
MTGFSDAMRRVYDAVKDIPWSALSALEKGSTISAGEFQLTLFKPGREGIRNASVIFTTIIPCDREELTQDRKIAVKAYPNVAERVKKLLEYHKTVLGKSLGEYLRYDVPQSVEKLIALGILPPIYAHGTYQNREVSKYDEMMLVCYAFTEGQDLATFLNNQKPLMLGDAVRVKDALMVLYLKIFQAGFSPEFAIYNIIVPDDVSRPFNMIYTDTNNLSREPIRNLDGRLFSAHTDFDDWYSKRGGRQSSFLSNQFSSYSAEKVAALLAELVTTIE